MGETTEFLSKVTKPSTKALSGLRKLVHRLPSPNNYLLGKALAGHTVPTNILCFCRTSAKKITRSISTFHRDHHQRFVLLIPITGEGRVSVDTTLRRVTPLHAILIFPFQFHHYLAVRPEAIQWLFITFETAGDSKLELFLNRKPWAIHGDELNLISEFLTGWMNPTENSLPSLYLAALLEHWKLRLPALSPSETRPPSITTGALEGKFLVEHVNRLAQAGTMEELTIKTLAKKIGYSPSHLRARFSESTGLSLGRHLRELKLQQACSLLHHGGLNISTIADKCGFSSVYSFSRAFRKSTGVSPMQYRKQQKVYQQKFPSV